MRHLATLVFALSLAPGCGSTANPPEAEDPGADANSGPDLFACEAPLDCTQDTGHLGEITDADLRCGGELLAAGGAGTVLVLSQPGPYPTEIQTLVVLRGDGTAWQQTRSRCAVEGGCEDQNTTEWALRPVQLCDVETASADISGCDDPDGVCQWVPYGVNCVDAADTWSCDALP